MTDDLQAKWDEIVRINHDVPAIQAADAELTALRAEVSDATALAYNLDPDRTEPSEMGLCEQINHLGEHITSLRARLDREKLFCAALYDSIIAAEKEMQYL